MPLLQGLIFDLDGTLIDSAPDLRNALNKTLAGDGRRELALDEVVKLTGDGMLPMMSRAYAMTGEPVGDDKSYQHFQKFIQHYRNQKADMAQIYPHVREVLEHYRKLDIKMGVCTNKQEVATNRLLEELDLTKFFGTVAGGDTFQVHKPHPGHVAGVVERLGLRAENCVMIGDGPNDSRSAQGAGVRCILVTNGYGDVGGLGADALIDSFKDLPKAIEKLGFTI